MTEIEKRRRGRPSGRTARGEEQKRQLYEVALKLIGDKGFEKATLREMAKLAGVSPGLFYKYFPNKQAIVLELHEDLTSDMERRCQNIAAGTWMERSTQTLQISLETLVEYREELKSLIPVLVGAEDQNVFSGFSQFSRLRVQSLFIDAISHSKNPPKKELIEPLGRLTYLVHLAVLLFWLLDKSEMQKSTEEIIKMYGKLLKPLSLALKLGGAARLVKQVDQIVQNGLMQA